MYYVYIIYNPIKDIYYKGYSQNLEKRLMEHKKGLSRYTSAIGPWKLVYHNNYATKREALIEGRRIKRLNRELIVKLISNQNQ